MLFKASAPGSLMLLGEHAVLHGHAALVCALDQRIHVNLTPRQDDLLVIRSEGYPDYQVKLSQLEIAAPYHFILAVFKHFGQRIRLGCDIEVRSDFGDSLGLGSSSAVTVACMAAIVNWQQIRMTPIDMVRQGRSIVRSVQGRASGADIAAAVYGGVVMFQSQPVEVEKLTQTFPISLAYVGYKTKTQAVIEHVDKTFARHPELLRSLCQAIGQATLDGVQAIRRQDWQDLASIFKVHQGLQTALQVSNADLQALIDYLSQQPDVMAAKISGSGLGDCVVALGQCSADELPVAGARMIDVNIAALGVRCEKA